MQVARGVMLASKHGHSEVVSRLMKAGAPVQHLLIRAASVGDSEQLLVLLKAGAAVDSDLTSEAMLSACCSGHRGIVQLLLNAGASVFKQDRSHGRNALHLAAMHGHPTVVKALLAAGAAVNAADPDGSSALSLAVEKSHAAVVDELLRAGAALERRHMDYEGLLGRASDEKIRALLTAERQRRHLEAELCSGQADGNDASQRKKSKKQRRKEAARVVAAERAAVAKSEQGETAAEPAEAAVAADTSDEDEDEDEEDEGGHAAGEAEVDADAGVGAAGSKAKAVPAAKPPSPVPVPSPPKPVLAGGAAKRSPRSNGPASLAELSAAAAGPASVPPPPPVAVFDEAELDAARDDETFSVSLPPLTPAPAVGSGTPAQGFVPPSDLVAAGGRVVAQELDMESLARQARSFRRVMPPGQGSPSAPASDGGRRGDAKAAPVTAAAGDVTNGGCSEVSEESAQTIAELQAQISMLQLRVAAEQQCVLREQHITARMWMEKSQAIERADAAVRRCDELERDVSAWEAWHQSQRKQQRQRRQQALKAAPDELLRSLLADWGAPSVNALRPEERHRLAAGLATSVAALLNGKAAPPPGL